MQGSRRSARGASLSGLRALATRLTPQICPSVLTQQTLFCYALLDCAIYCAIQNIGVRMLQIKSMGLFSFSDCSAALANLSRSSILMSLIMIFSLSSCSSYEVKSTVLIPNTIANASRVALLPHQLNLSQAPRIAQRNPMVTQEIEQALQDAFVAEGYRAVSLDSDPEILITFDSKVTTLPNIMTPPELRYRKGNQGSMYPEANPRLRSLQERSFTLMVRDVRSRQLLWSGVVEHLDPELFSAPRTLKALARALVKRYSADRGK